jgi:hypothetical protein
MWVDFAVVHNFYFFEIFVRKYIRGIMQGFQGSKLEGIHEIVKK